MQSSLRKGYELFETVKALLTAPRNFFERCNQNLMDKSKQPQTRGEAAPHPEVRSFSIELVCPLDDVAQLLGYSRVAKPTFAFLISPQGYKTSLIQLLKTYQRLDVLVNLHNRVRRGVNWLT